MRAIVQRVRHARVLVESRGEEAHPTPGDRRGEGAEPGMRVVSGSAFSSEVRKQLRRALEKATPQRAQPA